MGKKSDTEVKMQEKNIMDYDTVALDDERSELVIIDQTKLPGNIEIIRLKSAEELRQSVWQRDLASIFWQSR